MNIEEGSIDDVLLSFCKLWAAVLDLAIDDALGIGMRDQSLRHKRRIMESSREWIMSDNIEPGSFLWICEVLEQDPKAKRESFLRKLKTRKRGNALDCLTA